MKFKNLNVGQWFDFVQTTPNTGSPTGPFKKTGKRTYLYQHQLGWYETEIGTITLAVETRERPDDAPNELVDIAVDFNSEMNGYVTTMQSYRVREGEAKNEEYSPFCVTADNRPKYDAMMEAVREAKSKAVALVSNPLKAEKVIVFLEGTEYLVVVPHKCKAKVMAGVGNPRHTVNQKDQL